MKRGILRPAFVAQALFLSLWLPSSAAEKPKTFDSPLTLAPKAQPAASGQQEKVAPRKVEPGILSQPWLVLGPFQAARDGSDPRSGPALKAAFDLDFLLEFGGETNVQPRAGGWCRRDGKEYRWQLATNNEGIVNLASLYGEPTNAIAYAWTEVDLPQPRAAVLGFGSDDGIKVWINGQAVHCNWTNRYLLADEDLVPVQFQAGANGVLVKVQNRDGGWGFACRALDERAQGQRLQAAVQRDDLAAVRLLVAHGAALNQKDPQGFTAWHLAQVWGRETAAQCLLEAGADPTIPIPVAGTPTGMLALVWTTLKENHPGLELAGAIDEAWYEDCKVKLGPVTNLALALPIIDEAIVKRLRDFHTSLRWPTQVRASARETTLPRGTSASSQSRRLLSGRDLDERTGYIRITQWTGWSIASFDALLEPMRKKSRLIIDVRDNGGGQDQLADLVIGRFLARPVLTSISLRRIPQTDEYTKRLHLTQPRGPWRYEGRVAVLFNEGCHSACEHFLSGMELAGALLVGRPTSGGCGGIQPLELPLGITLFCSKSISLHGNRPPLAGIEPQYLVEPTTADSRQGRDAFLEKAMDVLARTSSPKGK